MWFSADTADDENGWSSFMLELRGRCDHRRAAGVPEELPPTDADLLDGCTHRRVSLFAAVDAGVRVGGAVVADADHGSVPPPKLSIRALPAVVFVVPDEPDADLATGDSVHVPTCRAVPIGALFRYTVTVLPADPGAERVAVGERHGAGTCPIAVATPPVTVATVTELAARS